MKEVLNLSPTPLDEQCAQVGDINYKEEALKEINAFINQLRRQFGQEPEGCKYKISRNPHDYGIYYDLDIVFDSSDDEINMPLTSEGLLNRKYTEAENYAYNVESNLPYKWDEEAIKELNTQTI